MSRDRLSMIVNRRSNSWAGCFGDTYPMGVSLYLKLRRLGYRLAYRGLQVFWFVARPSKRGVKCLVTDHDRVLLVRHTYGNRSWDLPGGSIKRRESPLSAARREMREELGLDGVEWVGIGEVHGRVDRRHDTIHCFSAELSDPKLTVDWGELAATAWFARDELPEDLGPYVRPAMARAPAIGAPRPGT
jgi:8-oxo-dGTP pyrophosphatase MutT (NUDIX family)